MCSSYMMTFSSRFKIESALEQCCRHIFLEFGEKSRFSAHSSKICEGPRSIRQNGQSRNLIFLGLKSRFSGLEQVLFSKNYYQRPEK